MGTHRGHRWSLKVPPALEVCPCTLKGDKRPWLPLPAIRVAMANKGDAGASGSLVSAVTVGTNKLLGKSRKD